MAVLRARPSPLQSRYKMVIHVLTKADNLVSTGYYGFLQQEDHTHVNMVANETNVYQGDYMYLIVVTL